MRKKIFLFAALLIIVGVIGAALSVKPYYTDYKKTVVKSFSGTDIENIQVSSSTATIELLKSSSDEIIVESSILKKMKPAITKLEKDTLFVSLPGKEKQSFVGLNFRNNSGKIKIYLPDKQFNNIAINNDVGSINVEHVKTDTLSGHTKAGKIEYKNIHTSAIEANSEVGTVEIIDYTGELNVSSKTGTIEISTDKINDSIYSKTAVGTIEIKANEYPSDLSVSANTSVGSSTIFDNDTSSFLSGNGSIIIDLKTETGSIEVVKNR